MAFNKGMFSINAGSPPFDQSITGVGFQPNALR